MPARRTYRWLWIGLVAAALPPSSGLIGRSLGREIGDGQSLWPELALGVLLFWCCAGLYFRERWIVARRALRRETELRGNLADVMGDILDDGERSVHLLKDNLVEVDRGSPPGQEAGLYLSGAQAHAAKLGSLLQRVRALHKRLQPTAREGRR